MRTYFRFIALGAVAAAAALALAQDAWTLKRTPTVGETSKYRLNAQIEFGGMQVTFAALITEKVLAVEPSGHYTVESAYSDTKLNAGSGDQAGPEGNSTKSTISAQGEVLSIEGDDAGASSYRMANITTFRYPEKPVKVGDEWTVEIPADEKKGSVKATATFKVEGVEKLGGKDALKVRMSAKETEGAEPAAAEGMVWVDPKDGNALKAESAWTNMPTPMGPITAKVTLVREA